MFQALTPFASLGALEGTLFTVAFAGIVLALAAWAGRGFSALARRRGWQLGEVLLAITIAVGVTCAFEFVILARNLVLEWPQFFYRPPALAAASAAAKSKPDVFYIVLDRYASQDVLRDQFDFDNSGFTKFLDDRGFYTNPSAHNNYPYTTMSIASTMQADYLNDIVTRFSGAPLQTTVPFNETIRNDENYDASSVDSEIHAGDMRKWNDKDLQLKYGNLAAYKLPGVDVAAQKDAATNVNIFRLVLNSYLGYNLPYRPACYYAYPNGRDEPLRFASITQQLTGQAEDPRCGPTGGLK
jgi:hypothetical protein